MQNILFISFWFALFLISLVVRDWFLHRQF